jgi:3-keto-disaccharide hydrolase
MQRTYVILCVVFFATLFSIQTVYSGEAWHSLGGTWTFPDKLGESLFGEGSSDFNKAYYTKEKFSDFVFEIRLRKISANDGPIGLIVRYDDQRDEGYMLLIWPHGDYQFSRLIGQKRHALGSSSPSTLNKGNSWNRVKIIGKGSQIRIFINGEEQVSFIDDKYLFGRLGVVIHGGPKNKAEFKILSMNSL